MLKEGAPPKDFNLACLIGLPKKPSGFLPDGTELFAPSGTRQLSIVDASNRTLANIFRLVRERKAAAWVSESQRGFLPGRSMLRSVLDVDFAAQKISLKSRAGAIILFDCQAGFPSMCHDFVWGALKASGIPGRFIQATRSFHVGNRHHVRVKGKLFESVSVMSGVRQGRPLSPSLFAICADVRLRRVVQVLKEDEVVRVENPLMRRGSQERRPMLSTPALAGEHAMLRA